MTEGNGKKSKRAEAEEAVLAFWKEHNIFEKSLEQDAPRGEFVFYDGPPFATGLPHYGHLLAGTIKDTIPRYRTMCGYHVPRQWGWDCHGLPLENLVEKELGLESKRDIQEYGIAAFNEIARDAVLRYADDWKEIIPRTGRWVDMENDYRTMDTSYSESVWWAFKRLYDKGLIYKDFKSMHLCPRCETTLSNFEVAQGYKDVKDISVIVRMPHRDADNTYFLAWTTTPWTLPGNAALAVNQAVEYAYVTSEGATYIVAAQLVESVFASHEYTIDTTVRGSELVGLAYEPPFDYYHANTDVEHHDNGWKVYGADFVTTEDGTGIVHIAPAFGADDMQLARERELPIIHHVGMDGTFAGEVVDFAGMHVKQKDDTQSADIAIIKYLAANELLFAKQKIEHSYPHCWRCDTPLLNYAADSWFVRVEELKPQLIAENKKVDWVPDHIGSKRFHNLLEGAPDWAISRSRYWGAPLPVWECESCPRKSVIESIEKLRTHTKHSGNTYFVVRHGESEGNTRDAVSMQNDEGDVLTEAGRDQVRSLAGRMRKGDFDLIIASPFTRTKETAEIIKDALEMTDEQLITDKRIVDLNPGTDFHGRTWSEYHEEVPYEEQFTREHPGGENRSEARERVGEFLYDIEHTYSNKRILIVAHEMIADALEMVARGADFDTSVQISLEYNLGNAEMRPLQFVPLPHNAHFELDLHRPYIDEVTLVCSCGSDMHRVEDVFDCWFESGSMSYASQHYPFETDTFQPRKKLFSSRRGFPAHFIAEGLDQTRGWFYSSLVLGVALFGETPYRTVIVNGIVLAEDGQKMSKSLQNYPDPLVLIDRYGADAVRYYMLSSAIMRAEDLNFAESGVAEVARKVIGRLENVVSFYELYADRNVVSSRESEDVLDIWIAARLDQLVREVTESMDAYELDRAARPIADFIDDLSTWYVRRSRERFKDGDHNALAMLRHVLVMSAKVCAPFMPFIAEDVYRAVDDTYESVHLSPWPQSEKVNTEVLEAMVLTRDVVSRALEARARAGLKIRQPLQRLTIIEALPQEYLDIIADEVNVKEVVVRKDMIEKMVLDTELTDELIAEGKVRDLIRAIQAERKNAGLAIGETGVVTVTAPHNEHDTYRSFLEHITESTHSSALTFVEGDTLTVTVTKQ